MKWNRIVNKNRTCHYKGAWNEINIRDCNNALIQDPIIVANAFNKFFVNITDLVPNKSISNNPQRSTISQTFFHYPVTRQGVFGIIMSFKARSSAGFDGISSMLLKE